MLILVLVLKDYLRTDVKSRPCLHVKVIDFVTDSQVLVLVFVYTEVLVFV